MGKHSGTTALLAALMTLAGCMTPPATEEKTPVRSLEEMAEGKRNVKTVSEELRSLFDSNAPVSLPARSVAGRTAYTKLIRTADGRATLVFRPRFSTAKKMARALEGVMPLTSLVEAVSGQNLVVVNTADTEIENYRKLLEAMDVPQAQILIEAKIVEVLFTDSMLRNLSMSWAGQNGSLGALTEIPGQTEQPTTGLNGNFTPIHGDNTMDITFKWLENAQNAKVLSSPTILLSNCDEASKITTGEEIPIQEANTTNSTLSFTTKFKSVGVTLEVEPSLINDDNVTLRVFPKVSNVTRYEKISTGTGEGSVGYSVPVISARSVETYLKMHDKQVVMLGGLYSSRRALQEQRVPGVSDIPLIGEFFTGKNDATEVTQLVFFLKVHIIPPEKGADDLYFDVDSNAKLSESLGEVIRSTESFPIRKSTLEKLKTEIEEALPGRESQKRDTFRREDLRVVPQGTTPVGAASAAPAETPAKPVIVDGSGTKK